MNINPIYTQRVLKAYNEQLSLKPKPSRVRKNGLFPGDIIMISPESKKRALAVRVSQEIVNNLTRNHPRDPVAEEIIHQLRLSYGQPLEIADQNGDGLTFMIPSEKQGEPPRYVSKEENEILRHKLLDIAQNIVYGNLSKGGR